MFLFVSLSFSLSHSLGIRISGENNINIIVIIVINIDVSENSVSYNTDDINKIYIYAKNMRTRVGRTYRASGSIKPVAAALINVRHVQ